METIVAWFNDSTVQGLVLSPLIGAILGVLFAGLNNPPPQGVPLSVQQTIIVYKQTIIVNQVGGASGSSEDGFAIIIGVFLLIAGITWGYSVYADQILSYWMSGLYSCAAFVISAGLASAVRGQFDKLEWAWYIFMPVVAIIFCHYLIGLAHDGVIPGAKEAAQSHSFVDYYLNTLNSKQKSWILFQILGVFLGIMATLTAALRSVYYLALMNQRANGGVSGLWRFIARHTEFSAQGSGLVVLLVTLSASYVLLSGHAYIWWPVSHNV